LQSGWSAYPDLIQETRFSSPIKGNPFLRWSLAWASDHAGLAESSPATQVGWGPAQLYGPGWAQQNNKKKNKKKIK